MKIDWKIEYLQKFPNVSSYMYGSVDRMKQNIRTNKKVFVSVNRRTKTTVNIELFYDEDSFSVAHIPAGAERFKFVEATDYSFFSGRSETRHYFRISKKQGLSELKKYLELVLNELCLDLDNIQVEMRIIGIDELKNITA